MENSQATRELEGTDIDHKITRGLVKPLIDGCDFETVSPLPPAELRWLSFRLAAETGPLARHAGPTERRTANDVLTELAATLEQDGQVPTADMMADALYADLKEHQRIQSRKGPTNPEVCYSATMAVGSSRDASTGTPSALEATRTQAVATVCQLFFQLMYRVHHLKMGIWPSKSMVRSLLKHHLMVACNCDLFQKRLFHKLEINQAEVHGVASASQPGWNRPANKVWLSLSRHTGTWRSQIEIWFEEIHSLNRHRMDIVAGTAHRFGGSSNWMVPTSRSVKETGSRTRYR